MPEETNTEEVIVEETPVEETPVEETPTEESPTETPAEETPVAPVLVTLPFTITNTRENLEIIARSRGYQDMVRKAEITEGMSLQDMLEPNPQDPIDWLDEHIKDFLADVASKPFIEATARAKQAEIDVEKGRIRQMARGSIS